MLDGMTAVLRPINETHLATLQHSHLFGLFNDSPRTIHKHAYAIRTLSKKTGII